LSASTAHLSFFFECYGHPRALHSFPTRRSSDLSLAALGVVALGVGAGFGLHADAKKEDSDAHCNDRNVCNATGIALRDDAFTAADRKSTRLNSSHVKISYAVFCLKKKKKKKNRH